MMGRNSRIIGCHKNMPDRLSGGLADSAKMMASEMLYPPSGHH